MLKPPFRNILLAMSANAIEGVLARLACAKGALGDSVPAERRRKISSLQSAAVVEQLKSLKEQKAFKSEHKAQIMDATVETKFCPEHADAILAELEDSPVRAEERARLYGLALILQCSGMGCHPVRD